MEVHYSPSPKLYSIAETSRGQSDRKIEKYNDYGSLMDHLQRAVDLENELDESLLWQSHGKLSILKGSELLRLGL